MKSLRKSFLTLLALTLFGGAGAWAQGPTNVTQFTTELLPASWQGASGKVTLADLQALGFEVVDQATAELWAGAPTSGQTFLFYDVDEGIHTLKFILFNNGNMQTSTQTSFTKSEFYNEVSNGTKWFYTGSPAIELTKSGANQWTLGQTPDYDLELQVEYYEAHALKEIPEGWTVKVNGVAQQTPYQGDSLMIVETDSVTLVPAGNPRRVKSVTLEEDARPTITVAGLELIGQNGDSWATIAANNPGKIELVSGYVYRATDAAELKAGDPNGTCFGRDPVNSSSNYSADAESNGEYIWCHD